MEDNPQPGTAREGHAPYEKYPVTSEALGSEHRIYHSTVTSQRPIDGLFSTSFASLSAFRLTLAFIIHVVLGLASSLTTY